MVSKPLRELMGQQSRPRVLAGERRSAKFGNPMHQSEGARAASFKRAIDLCEWAMSEFVRAGHNDAARAVWSAIDAAEGQT